MASDALGRSALYAQRLIENEYIQDKLGEGVRNLRAAYDRASRRKALKAAQDKKIHRRISRGAGSLAEAAAALRTGRKKPKRRVPRVLIVGVGAGAAAIVANKKLRRGAKEQSAERSDATGQPAPEPVTA